jgi:NAD(P)-dependent dehydrogenase (short-subunit alcohol dehydrogenase family)
VSKLTVETGICGSQPFENATLDDFDQYWRVHLGGPVNTVKASWPHMVRQRRGKIILTTSVVGLFGMRGQATYAAAKSAVVGLMRILAIEGAEHGILVNTISPNGYTRKVDSSEMLDGHRDQVTTALRGGNIAVICDCLASA